MNPAHVWELILEPHFPRASGDEPEGEALMKQEDEFSPREWG